MKPEFMYARDHLFDLRVLELRNDGGSDDRVDVEIFVPVRLFENVDHFHDHGLIHDRAEGALIDARAAGNAFIVVDDGLFVLSHGDRLHFARIDARALLVYDRPVRAGLGAFAAFDALAFIHDRLVVDDLDGVFRADLLTAVHDAAAAGGRDEYAADRALVAGDIDHLDDVRIVLVPAQRKFDALLHDGALFENTAAHRRLGPGRDLFGDVDINVVVAMFVFVADDRLQNVVFEFLYGGIENSFIVSHIFPLD